MVLACGGQHGEPVVALEGEEEGGGWRVGDMRGGPGVGG